MKTSLTAVARACGCENVVECQAEDTAAEIENALNSNRMTVIVSKCESGNIPDDVIDMNPIVIGERFMAEVKR